ncbi:MAG: P1 family peptidase [Clostridia bacterium]|nr:P1 family peptidase [Clostridia bacterium]
MDINSISGFRIGNAQDYKALTGVTAIICPGGAAAGVWITGGGPASRETTLAGQLTDEKPIHAVVLSGGSAFGLAASDGVMRYLEQKGIGFDTGYARVPLVMQSSLYDLCAGSARVRPDAEMGYAACVDSERRSAVTGILGAGTGATLGKLCGIGRAMKSGMGVAALQADELQIGAVVAVNALGDVYDFESGEKIAGLLNEGRTDFSDSEAELSRLSTKENLFAGNTTIGCVITNATLTSREMTKVASQAINGYARSINPVGTTADGDSVYALASGRVSAHIDVVGTLAARVVAMAIRNAVLKAREEAGFSALNEAKQYRPA